MKFRRRYIWAAILSFTYCSCYADPLLQKNDVGRSYSLVRQDLKKAGDVPVNQGNLQYNCDTVDNVCLLYPEEMDCGINVVSQPAICSFEWKSQAGLRYTITTAGEDPHKFVVTAISPTPQSLFDRGMTK